MNSDLELLLKLQTIDYDIGELERSKEYLPDMMSNLKHELEEANTGYETCVSDLEETKLKQKSLELEVSTQEADLQKFQQQMMAIKTNKEYDALVSQIDSIKSTISGHETELLESIDRISQLESDVDSRKTDLVRIDENNNKQLTILQKKMDSIGDKMSSMLSNRKDVTVEIPKKTFSIYERVRKGKGGTVVVVVKRRACGACYSAMTPKKVQEIKRANGVHTCDNCGRLVFWDDDLSN